uniref:NADH-ubiquinone oxidoreductase chain 3 n=1 Tax=Deporaus betulae TaxID=298190 RepID=J9PHL5_DEPBE|nr:NADH dehydrogenase subunit 3 [Deporaus betulae]
MIFMLMSISAIILLILTILVLILNLISKKTFSDREKSSPFECGFDPKNSARLPFSLQFFLIAVIFLVFDVELTLLIPMVMSIHTSSMINYSLTILMFILILIAGLYHEWAQGTLEWAL